MTYNHIFKNSKLVVAHPDDEILWFSSIIDNVDEIIICYMDIKSRPALTSGRKQSISEHPLEKKITCLNIDEAEVYNGANWHKPVLNNTGIEISNNGFSDKKYIENYYNLKVKLEHELKNCSNVFTHNPWGDYGNEEHIQIYRIIKQLQSQLNYSIWFSNYCSNQSFNLMFAYISSFNTEYITLKTNEKIGNEVKQIYLKNDCWTWLTEWRWFNYESFLEDKNGTESENKFHHIFPLNMMKIKTLKKMNPIRRYYRTIKSKIMKIFLTEN